MFLPIIIPAFALMFTTVEILPAGLQASIYAIPFSYASLAANALCTKEYTAMALGEVYLIVFDAIVLFIVARSFASEDNNDCRIETEEGAAQE